MNYVIQVTISLMVCVVCGFSLPANANANELPATLKNSLASVKNLQLGKFNISIDITVKDSYLAAEFKFNDDPKKTQTYELPSPVVPQATIQRWNWGHKFPDLIAIEITGGTDGESSRFYEVFAVVDKKIKKVFSVNYLDHYYFRRATCGKFDATTKNEVYLIEEKPLSLTKSKLVWDESGKFIRRVESGKIKITVTTLEETKVYAKPSLFSKSTKNFAKGSHFELIGFQFCDPKKDGDEACSIEPSEKNRWFKVKDPKGKIHWLWEQEPVDSNLDCNQFMSM